MHLKFKEGGAVAEWSKALLVREKINENKKDRSLAILFKMHLKLWRIYSQSMRTILI